MKAYITCPVSHSQKRLSLLPTIEKITREVGLDAFVFKVGGEPQDIFNRDYEQLKSCQVLIADVSERSHGVGIEIGISFCLGLKRVLLLESGQLVTKLAQGMPDTIIIQYDDESQLTSRLREALGGLFRQSNLRPN